MHHLHSARSILFFRMTALLLLAKGLVGMIGVGLLMFSVSTYDFHFSRIGALVLGLGVVLAVFQWLTAISAWCPLCVAKVMTRNYCAKHRRALRILGSHRLPVAVSILCKGRFSCPYCHEVTELKLRTH